MLSVMAGVIINLFDRPNRQPAQTVYELLEVMKKNEGVIAESLVSDAAASEALQRGLIRYQDGGWGTGGWYYLVEKIEY
jgi:hypothetical protein